MEEFGGRGSLDTGREGAEPDPDWEPKDPEDSSDSGESER